MNIRLERAGVSDAEALTEIQKKAFERLYKIYRDESSPYLRGPDEIKNQIENNLRDVCKILYCGELCGGISVRNMGSGDYYLNRVYVLPELQGRGIGKNAIALCEKNYPDAVYWSVDFPSDQIANKKCYEHNGYRDTGLREKISERLTLNIYEKPIRGIFEIRAARYEDAAGVIRAGFKDITERFGITELNCPHASCFATAERLLKQNSGGRIFYGIYDDARLVGCASFSGGENNPGVYELSNLAVLPDYRRRGCGKMFLDFFKQKTIEAGGNKIEIGMINENSVLRKWYETNGFVHTGKKKYPGFPFTSGYMEWSVK